MAKAVKLINPQTQEMTWVDCATSEPITDPGLIAQLEEEGCCPTPFVPECIVKRTACIGYDNGVTPGSSTNQCARDNFIRFSEEFEVLGWGVNGSDVGVGQTLGPFTGWTEQLQGWADFFNANDPNYSNPCSEAEFGFLPAPTWRYAKITTCNPTAKYGQLRLKRVSDGCEFTVYPILESETLETFYRHVDYDCNTDEKNVVYCDSTFSVIAEPECPACLVSCGFPFSDFTYDNGPECDVEVKRLCDIVDDITTQFICLKSVCNGVTEQSYYTAESWDATNATPDDLDGLVVYDPKGKITDCNGNDVSLDCPCNESESIKPCDEYSVDCYKVAINEAGNPTVTTYGQQWTSPLAAVGVGGQLPVGEFSWSGNESAIYGPPDGNYGVVEFDGQGSGTNNIIVNNGQLKFDLSGLPSECDPIKVTLKAYAVTVSDDTGEPISAGPVDALAYALNDGVGAIPYTSIIAGAAPGNAIWDGAAAGGVSGAAIVCDAAAQVGDTCYIEAEYTGITAQQLQNLCLIIAEDNDEVHPGSPALDAVELVVEYDPNSDCLNKKAMSTKDCNSDQLLSLMQQLLDEIQESNACAQKCDPIVDADAVCNSVGQELTGIDSESNSVTITVPAGQPIIRKTITTFASVNCDCLEVGKQTKFFDFNEPTVEITSQVAFEGACNSTTETVTRCDRNGNEIQVISITVFTDDGGLVVTSYADANGNPIPEPLLPLSICNPDVEPVKACLVIDGVETYGIMHVQYDNAGMPGYDVSVFTSEDGASQLVGSTPFKLCCDSKTAECTTTYYTACYDTSSFSFPCVTPTLNGVELCGENSNATGVFVTEGDICQVGGIRSEDEATRHPFGTNVTCNSYDPSSVTTDALDVAGAITRAGNCCIGGSFHSDAQTVKTLISADSFGLSGTAPTITLSGDWMTGSGIAVGVYDCAQNLVLPFAPGETQTPSTYDQTNCGVEVFNSPTGAWGNNGSSSWQVDTSSVSDLSTLIIYTTVINPTGDELCNLSVNGVKASPPVCQAESPTDLAAIMTQATGITWSVVGESICGTSKINDFGPLCCGAGESQVCVDPTVTSLDQTVKSQRVQLDECSNSKFDQMIDLLSEIRDLLNPTCEEEEICTALVCFQGFHQSNDNGFFDSGSSTGSVDGVVFSQNWVGGYTNKSEAEAQWIATMEANPNVVGVSIVQDAAVGSSQKTQFQIEVACGSTVSWSNWHGNAVEPAANGRDDYSVTVDAEGNVTGSAVLFGDSSVEYAPRVCA